MKAKILSNVLKTKNDVKERATLLYLCYKEFFKELYVFLDGHIQTYPSVLESNKHVSITI